MDTRQCYKCKEIKEELKFKIKRGKITNCCTTCHGRYYSGKKWKGGTRLRSSNPNTIKIIKPKAIKVSKTPEERALDLRHWRRLRQKKKFDKNCQFVGEYLENNHCVDCGESNIIVLDFDHRNPSEKSDGISKLLNKSIKRIKLEIEKCDVVCSNCHRIRTAKMFGNWRLNFKSNG